MQTLSPKQFLVLAGLTVVWGLNWPIMKLAIGGFPPLTFRAISVVIGVPVLALGLRALRVPFAIPRRDWPELVLLATFNMFFWHAAIIVALSMLSSGRAAILGYTMPIFSAVFGAVFWRAALPGRAWLGVGAAALGVVLLLWHEVIGLAGRPWGVALALFAAATWAIGTQRLRRTRITAPTLAISFWMTALTAIVMGVLAAVFERDRWVAVPPATLWGIAYNAVAIFGFAHAAWFYLARSLPPVASTLSVMLIPVLGVFSGAIWLGEVLHWQDWAAVGLMMVAIASVLWPSAPRASA